VVSTAVREAFCGLEFGGPKPSRRFELGCRCWRNVEGPIAGDRQAIARQRDVVRAVIVGDGVSRPFLRARSVPSRC